MKIRNVVCGACCLSTILIVLALTQADNVPSSSPTSAPASAPTSAASQAAAPTWMTNFEQAKAMAKKEGKPILLDFTGSDWCGWCKKLKAEVFDKDEFQSWAAKNVILLEVDFPRKKAQDDVTKKQNKSLSEKYNIEGFPTIVFIKADGTEIGRTGYVKGGPAAWIKKAAEALDAGK